MTVESPLPSAEISPYGFTHIYTPNLDKLAKDSVTFERAYAQIAVCGPSRNSILSGRRPDASRSWNFINHFREDHPEWTSLPGLFLNAGSQALGSGKTYHPKLPPFYDSDKSWSAASLPYHNPCWNTADLNVSFQDGGLPCVPCPADVKHYVFKGKINVANEWCEIDAYEDTLSVDHALELLRGAASKHEHFYLAVGMHKPHIPFQAAPEDFAHYGPIESIDLPLHRLPPTDAPDIALVFSEEDLHHSPWEPLTDNETRARC